MGEKVRRIRLLAVVGVAGLLAFVAAWPTEGAAAEPPPPLYLARERGAGGISPEANTFVMIADGPRLVAHLLVDREQVADLEFIDSTGRVVVPRANGQIDFTGEVLDVEGVELWLQNSFSARWRLVDGQLRGDPDSKVCRGARQTALNRLSLPTHEGTRDLTLAETFVEADQRIAAMHRPVNQIPVECFIRNRDHKAGYLHNLWHRITGS